jgi:chorismate mutase
MEQLINTELPELPGHRPGEPILIAGPCSAETEMQTIETARQLSSLGVRIFRAGIWKPRTRPGAFEGVGSTGFSWLKRVREETGMHVAVEVATAHHVYEALKFGTDVLWVGARTTANPFAVQEIAEALKGVNIPVLIKNPVNPDLELWIGAFERINRAGVNKLCAVHRGFSSSGITNYRNQPLWEIPLQFRRKYPQIPMINDPSHISGRRDLVGYVATKAMDLGFDGLIIESHYNPDEALSDKNQQLTPADLKILIDKLARRTTSSLPVEESENLEDLRSQIDYCDHELLFTLLDRMRVSEKIGQYKKNRSLAILQMNRWNEILNSRLSEGRRMGLREEFVEGLFNYIHQESVNLQTEKL